MLENVLKKKMQVKRKRNTTSQQLMNGEAVTPGGTRGLGLFGQSRAKAVGGCVSRM